MSEEFDINEGGVSRFRKDMLEAEQRLAEQNSHDPAWVARQLSQQECDLLSAADAAIEAAEKAYATIQRQHTMSTSFASNILADAPAGQEDFIVSGDERLAAADAMVLAARNNRHRLAARIAARADLRAERAVQEASR